MSQIISLTYTFRQTSLATAAVIIVLIILDLLMTRQILPYGTASASVVEFVSFYYRGHWIWNWNVGCHRIYW